MSVSCEGLSDPSCVTEHGAGQDAILCMLWIGGGSGPAVPNHMGKSAEARS